MSYVWFETDSVLHQGFDTAPNFLCYDNAAMAVPIRFALFILFISTVTSFKPNKSKSSFNSSVTIL